MASLNSLPSELLERILCCPQLRARDITNCCIAASSFNNVCTGDNLWRAKLKLHYPSVLAKLQHGRMEDSALNARKLYAKLCDLYDKLVANIMALSNVFVWSMYHDYEWPDIPHRALNFYIGMFDDVLPDFSKYYVVDECYNIIHHTDPNKELTLRYYAQKVYYFLNSNIIFEDKVCTSPTQMCDSEMKHFSDVCNNPNVQSSANAHFDYLKAAQWLARTIPMTERIDEDAMKANLKMLYLVVDDKIRQYRPDILKNNLRANDCERTSSDKTWVYNGIECGFLLKQIHDTVRHDMNFKSVSSFNYKGYRYCIDKVLLSKVGDDRILVALEAHLAQHYGICFEVHDNNRGQWKIFYKANDGKNSYYQCRTCSDTQEDTKQVTVITESLFYQKMIGSLVKNFEMNLKNEWYLAGGPNVYNLLDEDTYDYTIRVIFTAWRHVEHWKIALLRHYTLLQRRVRGSEILFGKILHLNILLRVRSNQTLEALTNFRRTLQQPPGGIRDLQRMVASVNIRAKARNHELKAMLNSGGASNGYFLATFHPSQVRPWPHGWPGSDMVQKRRVDRKSWHVQFAVGQIVEIVRGTPDSGACSSRAVAAAGYGRQRQQKSSSSGCKFEEKHSKPGRLREKPSGSGVGGIGNDTSDCADDKLGNNLFSDDNQEEEEDCDEPPRKMDRISPQPRGSSGRSVIYDWDSMCIESDDTLEIMGETDLKAGKEQPFYRVLLDDGSSSYIAQENIEHARDPRPISNPLLGRYFRAYVKPYYIPNVQKAYEYPEDATIREQDSFALKLL